MKKPVTTFQLREVMDEAVRRLAISTSSMQERLQSAAAIMVGALSPADFDLEEERTLFLKIQETASTRAIDTKSSEALARSDAALEKFGSDILDLRDAIMGRALREARMSTPHYRKRGS